MANPSCIVESGKLSPVGQRNLSLFRGQNTKQILVVLMSDSHRKAGYYGPTPSASEPTAWMLPCLESGNSVNSTGNGMRSDSKAVIVLTASEWATRRDVGRFRGNVFQVWGDGGDAKSWAVMSSDAPQTTSR